jgi:hypothetical protein
VVAVLFVLAAACRTPPLPDPSKGSVPLDAAQSTAFDASAPRIDAAVPIAPDAAMPTEPAVDQSNVPPVFNCSLVQYYALAQSFAVGRQGTLTGIELAAVSETTGASLQLVLTDLSSGMTLAKASIDVGGLPRGPSCGTISADHIGPAFFDLTSAAVQVTVGQHLVIDVVGSTQSAGMVGWSQSGVDEPDYPGGEMYVDGVVRPLQDLVFKTFVR